MRAARNLVLEFTRCRVRGLVTAPDGRRVSLTVDGVATELVRGGSWSGALVLDLV